MNRWITALAALGWASLASGLSAAEVAPDDDLARYRCVVGGERAACRVAPPPAALDVVTRLEPGSYARYLMHAGWSRDDAIAKARQRGEHPQQQVLRRLQQVQLTHWQIYQRAMGYEVPPAWTEEVLSTRVDDGSASAP